MFYCPKCGSIKRSKGVRCGICFHTPNYEINPKWGITEEKYNEIMNQVKYGEKTSDECYIELDEFCTPFYEEVVKKHPDYDEYTFTHRWEIMKKNYEDYMNKPRDPAQEAFSKKSIERTKSQSNNIQCPYCKSHNTKKISALSRGLSFSFLGFGSGKVGKQWHCNGCGSDF